KLAREAISFIDRVFCVFEDHAALVFKLRTDDEIKIEVWHWSPLPCSNCTESNLSPLGSPITTLLLTSDCGRLLRFGTATAPSRAQATAQCRIPCSIPSVLFTEQTQFHLGWLESGSKGQPRLHRHYRGWSVCGPWWTRPGPRLMSAPD